MLGDEQWPFEEIVKLEEMTQVHAQKLETNELQLANMKELLVMVPLHVRQVHGLPIDLDRYDATCEELKGQMRALYDFVCEAKRAWVHTCTLDHENALKNYLARGMKIFKKETISI